MIDAQHIKAHCDPGTIVRIKFEHIDEPQEYKVTVAYGSSYLKKVDGEGRLPIWDFVHATYLEVENAN